MASLEHDNDFVRHKMPFKALQVKTMAPRLEPGASSNKNKSLSQKGQKPRANISRQRKAAARAH